FWEALRGEAPGHETSLAKGIAQLLLQWERFRVLFNLMLIWEGVLLLSLTRMLEEASKHHEHTAHGHWFWGMALLCCVVANGFFSLGPLAEAGAHMTIRIRFGQLRLALFGLLLLPPSLVMWLLARRQWGHVAGYL
ncbi:MAG: hypothetical protein GY851_34255, partial [bacterium]|nr:hypothetical protein [bacterium]